MEVPRHDFIIILIIIMIIIVRKRDLSVVDVELPRYIDRELARKEPQFTGLPDVASS